MTRFYMGLAALAPVAIWLYLLLARGGFWRMSHRAPSGELPAPAPSIVGVIPARNEAAVVGRAIRSLAEQEYSGEFRIVLVDDDSSDGTADSARQAAPAELLTIVRAAPLPAGWSGKLWAVSEGIRAAGVGTMSRFPETPRENRPQKGEAGGTACPIAESTGPAPVSQAVPPAVSPAFSNSPRPQPRKPDYFLLTDADIVHPPENLRTLVVRAECEGYDLVSYMATLECRTFPERALIPAFVFFFFLLYPPAWIRSARHATAGAAGGCILIRRTALERIGGIRAIAGSLIDDCALARAVKNSGGRVWLGLSPRTRSIRVYATFGEIGGMISRTAYTQLHHSILLLIGTIAGLAITYLAPPVLAIGAAGYAAGLGAFAWLLMSIAYLPILRYYGASPLWTPLLPLVATFYLGATLHSAVAHWRGRGGLWKGRVSM